MSQPTRALSLTQPWAWLLARGIKDIENRPPGFSHKSFRGRFWIHATIESEKSVEAFWAARRLCVQFGITLPPAGELHFGGIIGVATITGIIPPGESGRRWHFPEQWGFIVEDAREVPFVPCRGFQGFWGVPHAVLCKLEELAP